MLRVDLHEQSSRQCRGQQEVVTTWTAWGKPPVGFDAGWGHALFFSKVSLDSGKWTEWVG